MSDDAQTIRERAARESLGVDISDYSDEFCAGFLAGQVNVFDFLAARPAAPDAAREALEAVGRELERASDVRANRTKIIGNAYLIVQAALRGSHTEQG